MPGARSVSAGVWVGVGARDEPAALAGVSHFLEHLLFKGTDRAPARDIAEAVDAVGGDMNAFTTKEYTAYYARLPASSSSLGLDILADVLTAPAFRARRGRAERQVILEELLMDEDTPEDRVHTLLFEALFPGHPLGREMAGERATVEAMHRRRRRSFFDRWYRPKRWWSPSPAPSTTTPSSPPCERRFTAVTGGERPCGKRPTPRVPLAVRRRAHRAGAPGAGVPGLARSDPDREALRAQPRLGGGMSSRLFDEIREKRAWPTPSTRPPRPRRTRARCRSTPARPRQRHRRARPHRGRARPPHRRRHRPGRLTAPRATWPAATCSGWRTRRAGWPAWAGR